MSDNEEVFLSHVRIVERSKLYVFWWFAVTTVDSGSKALEFLGLRENTQSNDPNALSTFSENHQVRKFSS